MIREEINEAEQEAAAAVREREQLDAQIEQLRMNFLSQAGTTEEEFWRVLPDLLEEARRPRVRST